MKRCFGHRLRARGFLIALVFLSIGVGASAFGGQAAPEAGIPDQPPTEEINMFCGTGRLSAADYHELWHEWRRGAFRAAARGDALCQGYALSRLAEAARQRFFPTIAGDYSSRALEVLEPALAEHDIRWIPFLRQYVQGVEVADRAGVYRRLIRLLESARHVEKPPSALGCGDSEPYESAAKARTDFEIALLEAWSGLGAALASSEEVGTAVEAVVRVLDLLEAARWASGDAETPYRVVWAVGSAVRSLGGLAKAKVGAVPVEIMERGIELLSEIDRSYALMNALEDLASIRGAEGDLEAQELALRRALAVAEEQPATRSLAVRQLVEFVEAQGRMAEAEALLLGLVDQAAADGGDGLGSDHWQLEGFYLRNRRWPELRAVFEQRLVAEPESWYLLKQLGELENQEGHWVRAADLLKRSLDALEADGVEPHNTNLSSVLMSLGQAFRRSSREAAARRAYERAFEIEQAARHKMLEAERPVEPWTFAGSLRAALGSGDLETARSLLASMEQSLEGLAKNRQHYEALMPQYRARMLAAEGQHDRAVAELQRAADLFRDYHAEKPQSLKYALLHLGRACLELQLDADCWGL